MTRNLRIQLADLAEAWLRAARPDLSRERATDLISDWPLAEPWDEETTALVLSRFPAELVPVAGVHFLADAAVLVAESTAEPKADPWAQFLTVACPACGAAVGEPCKGRAAQWSHINRRKLSAGPLVEVTAQPTAEAVQ